MSNVVAAPLQDDTPPTGPLDSVSLSALLASRLCHDLINPVGAMGSGLEVLDDQSMDESMKDAALDLIRTGGEKSVSLLKYARLAYGASGGRGAELPLEEAEIIMRDLFQWSKAELDWQAQAGQRAKEHVKVVMILTHFASECVPRGGMVTVSQTDNGFTIQASGDRVIVQDDLGRTLGGAYDELAPKFAPAYVAYLLAKEAGGSIAVERPDKNSVVFSAQFAA